MTLWLWQFGCKLRKGEPNLRPVFGWIVYDCQRMAARRLFLVDSFNFIFRAFHARQRSGLPPMRTSRGNSTEAVYIFHNMIRRLQNTYKPEYLAAVFETMGGTFRDEVFPAYKANRTETPPELLDQIPLVEKLLNAQRIPVLQLKGYEADDIIGTLAGRAAGSGIDLVIVSSDKDMLQLVNEHVRMLNPMKDDMLYGPAEVVEFMGVPPERVVDLLALKGDSVDNIPGAPGIGDKGARDLIAQYGAVESVLEHAAEITRKTYRESLLNHREQVLLSKQLAKIALDAPLDIKLEDLAVQAPDREALAAIYKDLEFFSFLKDLEPAPQPVARAERVISGASELPEGELAALVLHPPEEAALGEGQLGLCVSETECFSAPWDLRSSLQYNALAVYDWKSYLLDGTQEAPPGPVHDVMLYAFLLLADPSACALDSLVARYLDGKLGGSAAQAAAAIYDLAQKLRPQIEGTLLAGVYQTIDLPLAPVLARMESHGIRVDSGYMKTLSAGMQGELDRLANEIYALAGHPFNINSPPQLGKVMFDEMKIPAMGKTGKTRSHSTAADVLEALAPDHPIAAKVLEYRQIAKLKGTYADALPELIDPFTRRVHTTFNAAGAATGRLSSSNPNLQNIPIRTSLGRDIRAAFIPEDGWVLISADYSQIELRLLAHFSGDRVLTGSFQKGEDIHTRTAAEVFGVPPLMVTPELRRNAKAVNFGIVYGQTPFGLAAQLGISRQEADQYIHSYFERYSGVKKWIDATIAQVRQDGFTRTIHGRRRAIPDINARHPSARSFAERTAVNTPLQGTAADLIKLAMIAIDRDLIDRGMRTRMLLQVHDELVLESPPEEVDAARKLVKKRMEGVARLKVPLLVETCTGSNWRDAK